MPYVVRQVGHITADHLKAGKYAGEIESSPSTTTAEQVSGQHSVIRESVIKPQLVPEGNSGDAEELTTTSGVVYDFQVRADGSFHIRSGKAAPGVATPGASEYGKPTDHTLDLQFDALTKTLKLRMGASGAPLVNIVADGTVGTLTVLASTSLSLQAPVITLPAATVINAAGPLTLNAPKIALNTPGIFEINALSLKINGGISGSWVGPLITVPGDVKAGANVSLIKHTHMYSAGPAAGAITPPPIPSPA
jgi:hypothetical protein